MNFLYHAHSGIRYLVLLAALAAVGALAYSLSTGRSARIALRLATAFTGLLDLQVVLGIGLVVGGVFPDAAVGHLVIMMLALAVTHAFAVVGRRAKTERRELGIRLGGIAVALILIFIGIMALGRGVLGSVPLTPS